VLHDVLICRSRKERQIRIGSALRPIMVQGGKSSPKLSHRGRGVLPIHPSVVDMIPDLKCSGISGIWSYGRQIAPNSAKSPEFRWKKLQNLRNSGVTAGRSTIISNQVKNCVITEQTETLRPEGRTSALKESKYAPESDERALSIALGPHAQLSDWHENSYD